VVPKLAQVASVSGGGSFSCALLDDHTVKCWGQGSNGELGDGSWIGKTSPSPVVDLANVQSLASGSNHTCALRSDGNVACWGANDQDQLGDGTSVYAAQPVAANVSGAATIGASGQATGALVGSTPACWGRNYNGIDDPYGVAGMHGIALGSNHACAIRSDRTVCCWGYNPNGQLGNGSATNGWFSPQTASGVQNAIAIYAQDDRSCALIEGGTAMCWGWNESGRLGVGNTNGSVSTPTTLGVTGIVQLALGGDSSCARRADGTVSCWGYNGAGAVGDGSYSDRASPVPISAAGTVKDITAGGGHICATRSDGTVECWGEDGRGQLGDGVRSIIAPIGVRMTCP
jgi:alpha-tubulin suppressor-like RCC1 family protein